MPIHPNARQCQHIKVNGDQCGSPALTRSDFCYFHHRVRRDSPHVEIPVVEDTNSLLLAISEIMRGVLDGSIESKQATTLLYALQVATPALHQNSLGLSGGVTVDPSEEAFNKAMKTLTGKNAPAEQIIELFRRRARLSGSITAPRKQPTPDTGSAANAVTVIGRSSAEGS